MVRHLSTLAALAAVLSSVPSFANVAAGVSDERVSLPSAPGSIDGVGENARVSGNQGAVSYEVKVEVPPGFPGVTPQLDLSYSSNGGSDVIGMGWSMPTFFIERQTSKGLQKYDATDRFVVDGSEELVKVGQGTDTAVYRSRFESGFVRYTWRAVGAGEGGYWTAEYPDGRVGYFGADVMGTAVPSARVTVPTTPKTFRWHLVALVDRFGHAMNVTWTKDPGGASLLDRMDYLYDGAAARHSVRLTYEDRPDVRSDGRPGFELKLTKRLKTIGIYAAAELIRSYVLTFESDGVTPGVSRLASVSRFGRTNAAYPVTFRFEYSRTLGGVCDAGCERPFTRSMGSLGIDFTQGRATLLDINGDALPDVLFSAANGAHTFYYSRLDAEGRVSFSTTGAPSARTTGGSAFVLGDPRVQVMDVNGDGFVDITQAKLPAVLCNDGTGDWTADAGFCTGSAAAPGLPGTFDPTDDAQDPSQQDPKYVRFFDYDNDKRIDWLRTFTGGTTTEVLANTPAGFTSVIVDNVEAVFDESPLQLADVNGDGLQDPVQLVTTQLQYKLNYGWGKWDTSWRTVSLVGFDPGQASLAELQDIDGDGLADVVAVAGNEVKFALNRGGGRFDPVRTLTSTDVTGGLPTRTGTTVVAFADMNGNGSADVVWMDTAGVTYLELFPVRPNLLARIDNAIGGVQTFAYGSSIAEQARDAAANAAWRNKLPHAMTLLVRHSSYVTLTGNGVTGLLEATRVRYHDGYYDGVEKQFRGYERVEREDADATTDVKEPGLVVETYDVGRTSAHLAGSKLREERFAGAAPNRVLLTDERTTWDTCAVADVPMGTTPAVLFRCERAMTKVVSERDPANAATTRTEKDYDGYGHATRVRNLGVVHLGTPEQPRPCAACVASGTFGEACGALCLGDEQYVETDYLTPGAGTSNKWLASFVRREASGAVAGMPQTETLTYFDGADFEGAAWDAMGAPASPVTRAVASRVARRTGTGATDLVTVLRAKFDTHGNAVERITGNGSVADTTKHRRVYTYDSTGLHLASVEVRTGGAGVSGIRRDLVTEATFERVSQASDWYPVMGGTPLQAAQQTRYRYDEHGRLKAILKAGDGDAAPTQEFTYELADPASRILSSERSAGTTADVLTAQCLDGRGRVFQTRKQLTAGRWQVDGFTEFDAKGAVVRRFQPYVSMSPACDLAAPTGVLATRFTFDAEDRMVSEVEPDGSARRVEYGPFVTRVFDEEAADMTGPHANTPKVERFDGLGRLVSLSRQLTAAGPAAVTRFSYDPRGLLATVRDPKGNTHTQTYDWRSQLTRVENPNTGATTFDYDADGNRVRITDARGSVTRLQYDGANRLVAVFADASEAATKASWTYDYLAGCGECTNTGGRLVGQRWVGPFAGEDRHGYDARGHHVFEQRSIGAAAFTTRRTYDRLGRPTQVTHPGSQAFGWTYDGAGREVGVTGAVQTVTYDDRGDRAKVTYANGATTDFTYDEQRRVSGVTTKSAAGQALLQLGFTRNRRGEIKAVTDGQLPDRLRRAATYTSDAWGRLTRAVLAGAPDETLDYAFDELDDVTSLTSSLGAASKAHVGAVAYGAMRPNTIESAGAVTHGYDAAGGLLTRGGLTLTRDFYGRVAGATGGAVPGAFHYADPDHRVAKVEGDAVTLYVSDDVEVRDGVLNVYARLGTNRVLRHQSAALAARVLSDLGASDGVIDIGDAWLAQAVAANITQLPGATPSPVGQLLSAAARRLLVTERTWLHEDHLASPVLATDTAGALVGERTFFPTGLEREAKGFVDAHGFTSQELDESTGLVHFKMRELDPQTARWDRSDPAFQELTQQNVRKHGEATVGYAYVANTFVNAIDPTGLNKLDWSMVAKTGTSKGQTREYHVGLHNKDDKSKPKHGVFKGGGGVKKTNDAWAKAKELGLKPDATGKLIVPAPKVGHEGGSKGSGAELNNIAIIVIPGTNKLVSAYPVK